MHLKASDNADQGSSVEIGPHAALQGPLRDILADKHHLGSIGYTSILKRGSSALKTSMEAVGELKCLGYPIDLLKVCRPEDTCAENLMVLPNLPAYQFDHSKSYWYESRLSRNFRTQSQGKLDLLGKPVSDWNHLEPRWRNRLRISEMPWMEDHVINGARIYPGAGMLVMAIEAAYQMADQSQIIQSVELKDVHFVEPLSVPADAAGLETQFSLCLSKEMSYPVSQWSEFRLCAYDAHQWHESCRGFVRVHYEMGHGKVDGGSEAMKELEACREMQANMIKSCQEPMDRDMFYRNLLQSGYEIGPSFQRIYNAALGKDQQAIGDAQVFQWPNLEYPQPHIVHPITLDAILQMSVGVLTGGGQRNIQTMVPSSLGYLKVRREGLNYPGASSIKACARMTAQNIRGAEFDYTCLDNGQSVVLAQAKGLKLTVIAGSASNEEDNTIQEWPDCFHIDYKPDVDFSQAGQGLLGPKNAESSFEGYLTKLAHKTPGEKVLEIGAIDAENTQRPLIEALMKRLDIGLFSYHYTSRSSSAIQPLSTLFARESHVTFGLLDITRDPVEQGYGTEAYDIIVAPNLSCQTIDVDGVLKHLSKLAKFNSWLLLGWQGECANKSAEWGERWVGTKGLSSGPGSKSPFDTIWSSESLTVLRKTETSINHTQHCQGKRIVLIINPASETQIQLAERITEGFSERNAGRRMDVLGIDVAADTQAKDGITFVVLLEFGQPFLYQMSKSS